MTDHRGVIIFLRQLDGRESFGERSNLIYFDQNRVGDVFVDSTLQKFHVGHEKIVSDELNLAAKTGGQFLPTIPIIFPATILDRDNRKTRAKIGVVFNQFFGSFLRAVGLFENVSVLVLVKELRGSWIE